MNKEKRPVHDALRGTLGRAASRATGDDTITEETPATSVVHEGMKSVFGSAKQRMTEAADCGPDDKKKKKSKKKEVPLMTEERRRKVREGGGYPRSSLKGSPSPARLANDPDHLVRATAELQTLIDNKVALFPLIGYVQDVQTVASAFSLIGETALADTLRDYALDMEKAGEKMQQTARNIGLALGGAQRSADMHRRR
jgi:hypothetical protein